MVKLPKAVGLILCNRIEIDKVQVEYSLHGLIHGLTFSKWPAISPSFMAYAALQGGSGEAKIEIEANHLQTERTVYRYSRWFTIPDPRRSAAFEARISRCVFPSPGRYSFSLRFDRQELSRYLLDVFSGVDSL